MKMTIWFSAHDPYYAPVRDGVYEFRKAPELMVIKARWHESRWHYASSASLIGTNPTAQWRGFLQQHHPWGGIDGERGSNPFTFIAQQRRQLASSATDEMWVSADGRRTWVRDMEGDHAKSALRLLLWELRTSAKKRVVVSGGALLTQLSQE